MENTELSKRNEELSRSKVLRHKGEGYLAFADILGFKSAIQQGFYGDFSIIERVLELNHRVVANNLQGLELNRRATWFNMTCQKYLISDAYVFCLKNHETFGISALGIISNIAHVWRDLIAVGFTIRGGIDYNLAYWDEKSVTGPALIDAYELESKVAKSSRIIISSKMNKHLLEVLNKSDAISHLNDAICQSFRKDDDGYLVLNPHLLYDDESQKQTLILSINKIMQNADACVKNKYEHLLCHLESANTPLCTSDFGNY